MVTTSIGPLRISPNGRYFVDGAGQPFFWLGDTQWQIHRDLPMPEVAEIVDDRAARGFNVLQVMVTGIGDGTVPNIAGETPWLENDPACPNEAYFRPLDALIERAKQRGMIVMLYLCHNTQRHRVTLSNARAYASWVARRYRDMPNIVWALVTDIPIVDELPIIRELVSGVWWGDGGRHLISYHPDPVRPAISSGEIHAESWLAFNIIQTWNYYEGIWGMVTRDYWRRPPKPVVMAEGAYEDGLEYHYPVTPQLIRQQAYWSYLAGGFHTYGHNHSWRWPQRWREVLAAPGAAQLAVLKDAFMALDWWRLVPDQLLLANQAVPGSTLNTSARSERGDWALIYLSGLSWATLDLSRLGTSGPWEATWLDPRDGTRVAAGRYGASDAPTIRTPEGWEDALLIVAKPTQ